MQDTSGKIFQEVDVITILRGIARKNKALQAKLLQHLEDKIKPDEFLETRKFVMDEINNFTRGVVREIFGDIESIIFPKR